MELETDRREAKIAKDRKRKRLPAGATSIHNLNDDLLELVLLGLDSPKCLLRAAATCKPWRRLVAGGAFLRRFRSLHAPPVVGTFYSINPDTTCSYGQDHMWPEVDPVFLPSSKSASASGGPNIGHQLSVNFVPRDGLPRELVDGRGSLHPLLMDKERLDSCDCHLCYHHPDIMIPDLVVCEPLTRQYLSIPPPEYHVCILGAFLRDGTAGIGMDNFRVMLVLYEHDLYGGRLLEDQHNGHGYPSASVFTNNGSNGGWWHHGKIDYDGVYLPHLDEIHLAGRTGGRIYWGCDDKQVLVLDEHTLKSSTMALSERMMDWQEFGRDNFRVVGGEAGTVRIVHLAAGSGELEVFSQAHSYHGTAHDWVLQMRVQLVEATQGLPGHKGKYFAQGRIKIVDAQEGFVVLSPENKTWLFSVHLETMELKREYGRKKYTGPAFQYTLPWPPVMRACVENVKKRRKRRRSKRRKRASS